MVSKSQAQLSDWTATVLLWKRGNWGPPRKKSFLGSHTSGFRDRVQAAVHWVWSTPQRPYAVWIVFLFISPPIQGAKQGLAGWEQSLAGGGGCELRPGSSLSPSTLKSQSEHESRSLVSGSLRPYGLYTVHRILQPRTLQWVAVPSSRGSSQLRDWTQVSCIAGGFFTRWATRQAQWPCTQSIL